MPTYASQADMVARFGERAMTEATSHVDPEATDVVADVMGKALADADGEINSYIGGRYTLPLETVPHVLVPFACDIARYRLYVVGMPEEVKDRYKAAIAFLRDVSTGKASLGIAAPQEAAAAPAGGVQFTTACDPITRASLRDW